MRSQITESEQHATNLQNLSYYLLIVFSLNDEILNYLFHPLTVAFEKFYKVRKDCRSCLCLAGAGCDSAYIRWLLLSAHTLPGLRSQV